MKSLTEYTLDLKSKNKKGLVTYITAGLPGWLDYIDACIDAGADIVEVGLPFSDPTMDGPVIAKASAHALADGARTLDLLDQLKNRKFDVPIAVMTYANVLYSHGIENIVADLSDANIKGAIVPDVTFEMRNLFTDSLDDSDISFIPLVAATTTATRQKQIADSAEGFIYCVAIKGVTGQDQEINIDFIDGLESVNGIPKYCGVGIRNAEDARNIISRCDGVIVGTSIVEKMLDDSSNATDVAQLVNRIRKSMDELG